MSSPYTPPTAPVRDPAPGKGSAAWAVIAGLLVDLGGSLVVGVALTILYGATLAANGTTDEAQLAAALANIPVDSWVSIVGMILGCMFSLAGGYVCARIARRADYRLPGIVAAISAVSGFALAAGHYPLWLNIAMLAATAASVMGGARLAMGRNDR